MLQISKPINIKLNSLFFYKSPNTTYYVINPKYGLVGDFSVSKRNDLFIDRLYVKNEFRSMGFGSRMLNFIKILSKQEGLGGKMRVLSSLLDDSQTPPHIFYRKYGLQLMI